MKETVMQAKTTTDRAVDLGLWARFMERLIEQTESGALKWELRLSGEYKRYAVCCVLGHELWYQNERQVLEVVTSGLRWTVYSDKTLMHKLRAAISAQVSPAALVHMERFAHEFLGEAQDP